MASQAEKDSREKKRVKHRQMDGLDRLIIFLPVVGPEEENFNLVEVDKIAGIPPSICASKEMTPEERQQVFRMCYRHAPEIAWNAAVFARVETGSKTVSH